MWRERLSGSFYFFYYASAAMLAPFLPVWLDNQGKSTGEIVFFASLLKITAIIGPFWWADFNRSNGRPYLSASLGMVTCGLLSLLWPVVLDSFLLSTVLLIFLGVVFHGVLPHFDSSTLLLLGDRSDQYGRIRVAGSFGYAFAGLLIAPLVISASHGFAWGMATLFFLGAVACLPMREMSHVAPEISRKKILVGPLARMFTDPTLNWLLCVSFILQMTVGAYALFFALWLGKHGHGAWEIGFLIAWGTIAEILVLFKSSSILRAISPHVLIVAALGMTMIRWVMIAVYPDNFWIILAAQTLNAFSFGTFQIGLMQIFSSHLRAHEQGPFQGAFNALTFGAGGLIGGLLAGSIWEAQGGLGTFMVAGSLMAFSLLWSIRHLGGR